MKGIIIYKKNDYLKNTFFVEKATEYMAKNNINLELVFEEDIIFQTRVSNDNYINKNHNIINLSNRPDFAIVRSINPGLSKMLELFHIKVFNNSKISEIANHKFNACLLGEKCGVSTIPTVLCKSFPSKDMINEAFIQFNNDELIIKSVAGHGGSEVFLVNKNTIDDVIEQIIQRNIVNMEYVIQPRLEGIARDIRIYILDNQIVGAILRTSHTDYRSNYSLGGSVKAVEVDEELNKELKKITNSIYMDYAGVDFIIDKNNKYYFNEIEDVVGARMLYECTDIDIISRFMCHIIDKICTKNI